MGDEKVPAGTTFWVNVGDTAASEWRVFGTTADDADDKESNGT
jgi:hypothetical protein|nr:MAG TPA: hypothetical protein [Caudoviricetes sp.]